MASNTDSQQAIIDHRRSVVGRLRLRGMSQREICAALPAQTINPDTHEPWSLFTVNADCKALDQEWRDDAARSTDDHKARILAELAQVKRTAWSNGDTGTVLKAIAQERAIRGVDAPVKQEVTGADGAAIRVEYVNDWRGAATVSPSGPDGSPTAGAAGKLAQCRAPMAQDDARDGDCG